MSIEVSDLKKIVRITSTEEEMELEVLRDSALKDMERVGIYIDEDSPLVKQAVWLYVKAYFGYDDNSERFKIAYEALRDSMSLSESCQL